MRYKKDQYFIDCSMYQSKIPAVNVIVITQAAFTCSKLTIETLEQGAKYIQLTIKIPERRQWRYC